MPTALAEAGMMEAVIVETNLESAAGEPARTEAVRRRRAPTRAVPGRRSSTHRSSPPRSSWPVKSASRACRWTSSHSGPGCRRPRSTGAGPRRRSSSSQALQSAMRPLDDVDTGDVGRRPPPVPRPDDRPHVDEGPDERRASPSHRDGDARRRAAQRGRRLRPEPPGAGAGRCSSGPSPAANWRPTPTSRR